MAGLVVPPLVRGGLAAVAFATGGARGARGPVLPGNGGNRRRLLAGRVPAFGTRLRGHLGTVPAPSFTDTARWVLEGRSYPSSSLPWYSAGRVPAGLYFAGLTPICRVKAYCSAFSEGSAPLGCRFLATAFRKALKVSGHAWQESFMLEARPVQKDLRISSISLPRSLGA
jgi:hypothetical protein